MQSDQSLCRLLEYFMTVKLLTEHQLEILSLKGGSADSYECTHIKIPYFGKSHVAAQFFLLLCGCLCSVSVGWSVVACDSDISRSYLHFSYVEKLKNFL